MTQLGSFYWNRWRYHFYGYSFYLLDSLTKVSFWTIISTGDSFLGPQEKEVLILLSELFHLVIFPVLHIKRKKKNSAADRDSGSDLVLPY